MFHELLLCGKIRSAGFAESWSVSESAPLSIFAMSLDYIKQELSQKR